MVPRMSRVFMKDLGFNRSAADHSVFYRHTANEHTIIAMATDDMVVTSKQIADIQKFKAEIKKHWETTDSTLPSPTHSERIRPV